MAQYGVLQAVDLWIGSWAYGCDPRALALFLDDEVVEAGEEWDDADGSSKVQDRSSFVTTAKKMRDRLQLLYVNRHDALEVFEEWEGLDRGDLAEVWEAFEAERQGGLEYPHPAWENLLSGFSDIRCDWILLLRFVLDRVDDDEPVTLDLAAVWADDPDEGPVRTPTLCADTRADIRSQVSGVLPTIVLTEGTSDAAALTAGIEIVRPHLTGFLTFMDYSTKAAGGVDSVVRGLKALAAAGVANRVIGLLDNDTAGREGFDILTAARLPARFTPLLLPRATIAEEYPTHGTEGLVLKDLNGIAVSIEMFFGEDVLRDANGHLVPVQLTGYNRKVQAYQGELIAKDDVKARFFDKVGRARAGSVNQGEWEGLGALLDFLVAHA